jgi:hypothetical protein
VPPPAASPRPRRTSAELSPELDPSLPAFRAALEETRFPPATPEWEVTGALQGRLQERMVRGMTTPAEALDALNA